MNEDALDLLRLFNAHSVRYLLVGAHAVGYYAEPRATGDLDLAIEPTEENAKRAFAALAAFGGPLGDLAVVDLAMPGVVYQMGVAPYRIDIITELSGVSFDEAWAEHRIARIDDIEVPVVGLAALRRNKAATGRPRDLLDLELLGRHSTGEEE